MSIQYSFFTGMPRSGSTVLACLLNQNPEIYVSTNSWLCHTLWILEKSIIENSAYNSKPDPIALNKALTGLFAAKYNSKQDKKIIFDKGFTWGTPGNYKRLLRVFNKKPKFVVCNRNTDEVIFSLINLLDKNPTNNAPYILKFNNNFEIRKRYLLDNFLNPIIQSTNNLIQNYKEDTYVVNFNELMSNPNKVVKGFYDFFEISKFKHNLFKIENTDKENDMVYGIPGMHDVRPLLTKKTVKNTL